MKILVTGGLGAVGAPLTGLLRERGHEVWVLDRPHDQGVKGGYYFRCDVGEFRQLLQAPVGDLAAAEVDRHDLVGALGPQAEDLGPGPVQRTQHAHLSQRLQDWGRIDSWLFNCYFGKFRRSRYQ